MWGGVVRRLPTCGLQMLLVGVGPVGFGNCFARIVPVRAACSSSKYDTEESKSLRMFIVASEIGRASCRERVYISAAAVGLKMIVTELMREMRVEHLAMLA